MTTKRAFLLTLPMLLVLPIGCHGSGTQATNSTADAASAAPSGSASAVTRPPLRPFRHQGLAGIALNGSHELQLTDEQAASVEKLQQELAAGDSASRTDYQQFQTDMAAGIRAGKLDQARMQPDFAAYDKTREAEEDREAEALNGLHAVLTPEQRTALVASLRTKQAAMDAQKPPEMPDGGVSERTKQTLARMTQDLQLEPGQQKRVSDLLVKDERATILSFPAHKEEQKKRVDAFVASFEQPDFDAKTLDAADAGGKAPHEAMEREVTFLSQLTAILKPEQREKLAAGRAPHAPTLHHPGMGGPGMGGPGMGGPGMGGPGMGGPGMGGPGGPAGIGGPVAPSPHP